MTPSDKFLAELQLQCYFASFSLDDMNAVFNNLINNLTDPTQLEDFRDMRFYNPRIWHTLHGVLIAAANISKILWPDSDYAARGERLRQQLGVSDDSPLRSRSLRNHFEHIDERIERWKGARVDLNVGPEPAEIKAFRHFDHQTGVVLFAGERYDLPAVVEAIQHLQQQLDALDPYP